MPTPSFSLQLNVIIEEYEGRRREARHADLSDILTEVEAQRFTTRARAAIERAAGRRSQYADLADAALHSKDHLWLALQRVMGVAAALRDDLDAGFVRGVEELIHGALFADFLEMADHLHGAGYKDPAAVLAGAALESHLRLLAERHDIPTVREGGRGLEPKKADLLNADLAGARAYSKLDQKSVTAWLDLRNKAAHGHHTEYTGEQVALLIAGVREFVRRLPA